MSDTDLTKNTTQKTKKMSDTDLTKNTTQKTKKMSDSVYALFVFVLCLVVCSMLPVSLDCLFLIASSVFSIMSNH
jgi:hypothetical protein